MTTNHLKESTAGIPFYHLVTLPKEHKYILVGSYGNDDFNRIISQLSNDLYAIDWTDMHIMSITRDDFFASIDTKRCKCIFGGHEDKTGIAIFGLGWNKQPYNHICEF